jgi:diguanylate cyclase (GGDEF)-like protein
MDIQALKTVAYEALPRPSGSVPSLEHVRSALAVGRYTSPAVLIVPLSPTLIADGSFDPAREARDAGVSPAEVAFLLGDAEMGELGPECLQRAEQLHEAGYLVAVGGVGSHVLSERTAGELRPSFVTISAELTGTRLSDQSVRAEIAALLAYFTRLGGRLIAREVVDAKRARSLLELGVQFGTGPYLGSPVVLEDDVAGEGDEVVNQAWFRARSVRVLAERPETAGTTKLVKSVPYVDPSRGPVGDREFARTLAEAARLLQAEHEQDRILGVIGDLLPRVVPVDRLAVFEADWDNHRLRAKLVVGDELAGLVDMDDSMTNGITGWAFPRGVPYNCPDTDHHPAAASVPGSPTRTESLVVIPLIAGDHRLGALDLWRDGIAQFSDQDVERCELFGYLAAAAWRNAQLYAELESRAMTDTLTGLLNTRWWTELAPREAAQSRRLGTEIAVLLCDLDHFKRVNDRYGHAAGDVVLRCTARVLRAAVRTGDAAVRYGGEEFLLMVRESDEEGALRVAKAVQEGLREMPTPIDGLPPLTASIGIAFFPRHGATLDEVLAHADAAMYQAKHDGRDRVVFAGSEATG